MDKYDYVLLMFVVAVLMTTAIGVCVPVSGLQLDNLTIDVLLNEDQYCFVDECTIRINDSNVLLNIINNTGDWIMVTNTTNWFIAPSNGTNCNQEVVTTVYFIVIIVVHCVTIIPSLANIILHLIVKELLTVSGKLVIALCGTIAVVSLITIVLGIFQLLHLVDAESCSGFKYATAMVAIAYESIKVNFLFHFVYLMFKSHKISSNTRKDKTFLYSYFICDAGVTLTCFLVFLVVDRTGNTSVFSVTPDGFCDFRNLFHFHSFLSYYIIIIVIMFILAETVLFITGIVLYYLVNRNLCMTKGQGNIRVIFTLFSTVGLNSVIHVCLNQVSHSSGVIKLGTSVATCVEQFTLLIIYLTSNKVKSAYDNMSKH